MKYDSSTESPAICDNKQMNLESIRPSEISQTEEDKWGNLHTEPKEKNSSSCKHIVECWLPGAGGKRK